MLLNLVGNAVKFTRAGSVAVLARAAEAAADAIRCRFEVRDSGPGISPERGRRLFERYEQGHESGSPGEPGHGLGLAISRELVDAMGGRIGVDSELGQGSTFWFEVWLPRGGDPSSASLQTQPLPRALGQSPRSAADLRILVVEDDFVSREVTIGQLHALGFLCEAVERGEDAVERLRVAAFDAVLLDVELPGMNGLEALALLRRDETAEQRRVVLGVTARASLQQRAECLDAGMDDVLVKPVALRTLGQALEFWLNCSTPAVDGRAAGSSAAQR